MLGFDAVFLLSPTRSIIPSAPAIPSGFCTPWPEHSVIFAESKLNASGYIASEQFNKAGSKCYYLYKRDGSKRLFTFENLLILGMIDSKDN